MTVLEFQTAFPAFAAVSSGDITRHMTSAGRLCAAAEWGDLYDSGFGNLTAHFIRAEQLDAAVGVRADDAIDKAVGQVRVSRSATLLQKQMADPFLRTSYGRMYRYLSSQVGRGAVAV